MILPEKPQTLGYVYDPVDFTKVWYFGDFLRKVPTYLKEEDPKKWEFICRATDIQNTNWTELEAYNKSLLNFEKDLANHIAINNNPFLL